MVLCSLLCIVINMGPHLPPEEQVRLYSSPHNFFPCFYCLLITFANSLDPDQDPQNVGLDLDLNTLTL